MRQDYSGALATLQLAQHKIELDEKDILKLARLYLHKNIPYSAAQLLHKAMTDGRIKIDASNLELLANSWAAAREPEKELIYLKEGRAIEK